MVLPLSARRSSELHLLGMLAGCPSSARTAMRGYRGRGSGRWPVQNLEDVYDGVDGERTLTRAHPFAMTWDLERGIPWLTIMIRMR